VNAGLGTVNIREYPIDMLDYEDREWKQKFGESYLNCEPGDDHLDDEEIDRLEEEFDQDQENPTGLKSEYGTLERLSEP
jgi:hypothetical protein